MSWASSRSWSRVVMPKASPKKEKAPIVSTAVATPDTSPAKSVQSSSLVLRSGFRSQKATPITITAPPTAAPVMPYWVSRSTR